VNVKLAEEERGSARNEKHAKNKAPMITSLIGVYESSTPPFHFSLKQFPLFGVEFFLKTEDANGKPRRALMLLVGQH
jgi:hypothetical protein